MKGKQEPANSQTPDTEEACKGIKSGDDALDEFMNRVELCTDTSIGTAIGFLLARAMLLNR